MFQSFRYRFLRDDFWLLVLLLLFFCGRADAQPLNLETNNLVVSSFPLDPYVPVLDGQWLGATVASDGNCYFSSSTHDNKHGATFFRYNPTNKVLTLLAEDITRICGENPTVTPPQGKIHSDIVEANGWLYFTTHLGNYWIEAEAAYTGGHVVGYELATGKFKDFGIVRSNYTCYAAVGVDKVRNKILSYVTRWWGPTPDSHMYRIDIATGAKEDLGIVPALNSFWFFVDSRGDGWFSCPADNGSLRVVRSATGTIQTFNNVLPEAQLGNGRWWDWAMALPVGNRCVIHMQGGNFLYFFDADAFQTNGPNAFVTVRNIGPADSGLALAPDRVYFLQRTNRQSGNQEFKDFHMMSVPLFANTPILDHGLVMDQSGRLVWRLPGMAADAFGRLYMVGDWWLLQGEEGTSLGTLRHTDDPGTNYTALPRGEFFGVADFSQSPTLNVRRRLLVTTAGGGTVVSDSPTNFFPGNAMVNLTATPSNGWSFLGWSGDVGGANPSNSIVLTRDKSVQAVFGTVVNTSVVGGGAIMLDPPGGLYPYGTAVRMTAVPNAGNYFVQWSGGTNGSLNPISYPVVRSNNSVTASFGALNGGQVSLTVLINGSGQVSKVPQQNVYQLSQNVTLMAQPDAGQSFSGWSSGYGTNVNLNLSLDTSKVITANFTERPEMGIQHFPGAAMSGSMLFNFTGEIGGKYRIEVSTNLASWGTLATFTNTFGSLRFTDPTASNANPRFYRAVVVQ
ncbi:MAG: exported protein of unknown function [Pedosphaera sp.]|nr:exported protein of unknown function [Pedosphaera sp.]